MLWRKSIIIFTLFWVSTLAASLVANFVSLLIFGPNTRTRYARQHSSHDPRPVLDLPPYGEFFGLSGFLYEKAVLNVGRVYDWIGKKNPFG